MTSWHPARQAERRARLFDLYRRRMAATVDAGGGWHGTEREMGFREKAWHCSALLAGGADDVRLANAILRSLAPKPCHFTPMTFLQLLRRHPDRLEPDVRAGLEAYVRAALPRAGGLRQRRVVIHPHHDDRTRRRPERAQVGAARHSVGPGQVIHLGVIADGQPLDVARVRFGRPGRGDPTQLKAKALGILLDVYRKLVHWPRHTLRFTFHSL